MSPNFDALFTESGLGEAYCEAGLAKVPDFFRGSKVDESVAEDLRSFSCTIAVLRRHN